MKFKHKITFKHPNSNRFEWLKENAKKRDWHYTPYKHEDRVHTYFMNDSKLFLEFVLKWG